MLFVGSKFCPHCGAAAAAKRAADFEKVGCPRCRDPKTSRGPLMEPAVLRDVHLDECPCCNGVWIDHATFRSVCTSAHARSAALDMLSAAGSARRATERTVRYLRCPLCNEQMHRRNYARQSGVILDICPRDGLWFDHDELRGVVEFIVTGGPGEAAAAEAERLAAERERKREESKHLGGDPWEGDPDSPNSPLFAAHTQALLELVLKRMRGR
jgi:Zn-finger nucleic acid-binding protein